MRVPRFEGVASSSHASKAKQRTPRSDTAPERALRRELWTCGLRYRTHVAALRGRPDIVFARQRLVIFCDGDFWHGRNWSQRRRKLERGANAAYWIAKIESNMRRDRVITNELLRGGWRVLRIWESDIKTDLVAVVKIVLRALQG